MQPFIHKYLPLKSTQIVGQNKALFQLIDYIKNYKKQKKKAVLLHGPTGSGKTSSVYAIANEMDLEVFELNSSDFRNKEQIKSKLGSAIGQQSLFMKEKLILVDDIDGLSGTKDRGALPEIIRLMQTSKYPVVLTVLNPYDNKFSSIRSKTVMIGYEPLETKDIVSLLHTICTKENLAFDEKILKSLASRCAGDMRAAINDLEILSTFKDASVDVLEVMGMREKEETMINALLKILKTTDPAIAIDAFDYVKEDVNDQLLWLDQNIPAEYSKPADLARAYQCLSSADIFNRRIRRWQHWRFLVYINALLTAGVATAKDEKYKKFVQYKPTGRILKMWWAKQKTLKKKAIAEKIGVATHTSTKEVLKNFSYYHHMFKKNKTFADSFTNEFELDKDEVSWMKK